MLPRDLDRPWSYVNAGDSRSSAGELQKIGAHAAADFDKPRAGKFVEAHHIAHPGSVFFVAVAFDFVKELPRAEFTLFAVNGSARVRFPLRARSKLFLGQVRLFNFHESKSGCNQI